MGKAVVAAVIALGLGSCGHETQMASYRDSEDGWTISYPESMRRTNVGVYGLASQQGVVISSFGGIRAKSWEVFRRFPKDGVAFGLFQYGGGGPPDLSPPEERFPLSRSAFTRETRAAKPHPFVRWMIANGEQWAVLAWFGPDASHGDKEKVWQIVESLRFPPQRTGTMSGDFYVLKDATHYPVGSVTRGGGRRFPGYQEVPPFFLIHAPRGMYAVSWRRAFEPKCHMAFDPARFEFYCRTHRGRWTRMGEVIEEPESDLQYNDWLDLGQAKVGRDGHVLVGNWIGPANYRPYERRFWPGLR